MDSHSARLLYDAGLTNISSVATASPENVEVLLKNARPFEEKLGETIADGRTLVAEARKMLQLELGVRIDWNETKGRSKISILIIISNCIDLFLQF